MIVITEKTETPAGKTTSRGIHVRADLIGKVVKFDGDHFIVDFVRNGEPATAAPRARRS